MEESGKAFGIYKGIKQAKEEPPKQKKIALTFIVGKTFTVI